MPEHKKAADTDACIKYDQLTLSDPDLLTAAGALIKQIRPGRLLDAGMLLLRFGALSRHFNNLDIDDGISITGIDIWKPDIPVYGRIYDRICQISDFSDNVFFDADKNVRQRYDLAVMLGTGDIRYDSRYDILCRIVITHSDMILTDDEELAAHPAALRQDIAVSEFEINAKRMYIYLPGQRL